MHPKWVESLNLRQKFAETLLWLKSKPRLSTWISAGFLGFSWTVLWLIVFFSATLLLDVRTPVDAFLLTFWLTVFVEAILRALENVDTLVGLADPTNPYAKGDDEHKFTHSAFVFMVGMVLLGVYAALAYLVKDVFALDRTLEFAGQSGEHTYAGIVRMFSINWRILNTTGVFVPLFVGTFFRIIIYRRSGRKGRGMIVEVDRVS